MIASQSTSTETFTRKLPRKASSRLSVYSARLPSRRRYLRKVTKRGTVSASERAITAQAQPEQPPRQDHEEHRPEQLAHQVEQQRCPLHLPQEHDGGKIGHVLERQDLEQSGPGLGEQVERQHVPRDEEVQGHHDVQQR